MAQIKNRKAQCLAYASLTALISTLALTAHAQQLSAPPAVAPAPATQIDSHLSAVVSVPAAYSPLSEMLRGVQTASGVTLSLAPTLPDQPLFVASHGTKAQTLLKQTRLLLTDDEWRYEWANQAQGNSSFSYRLWREKVSPQAQHEAMVQQAKARLAQWQEAMKGGQARWDEIRQTDPQFANDVRDPMNQTSINFLGTLVNDQLDQILNGQPMIVPFASLTPQQQEFAKKVGGADHPGEWVGTDAQGHKTIIPTGGDLSKGRVEVRAVPAMNDPGALSLCVYVGNQMTDGALSGGDALYPQDGGHFQPEVAAIKAQKVEVAEAKAGAKTVTIWPSMATLKEEPKLAAYLRSLADQSHLTILAYWPSEYKDANRKLPQSIVKRPAAEALTTLANAYHCRWVVEDKVVRFRWTDQPAPLSPDQFTPAQLGLPPQPPDAR